MMPSADLELRPLATLRVIERNLLRLKWHAAATRFELALRRHDRALKYIYKAYNPDQPRVPAGNPDGGQWSGGGNHAPRTHLSGDIPNEDIPREKPPTSKQRTAVLREVARRISDVGLAILGTAKIGAWLQTYRPQIESYRDPPMTLEELQQNVSRPAPGYDIHHIVEQTQAERDGFTRDVIDDPDNLVRVPTLRHQEINGWYQTANPDFGWLTPREYLSGRNWDVKRAVGLEALRIHGVLR